MRMSSQTSPWWRNQLTLSIFSAIRPGDPVEAMVRMLHDMGLNTLESNTPAEFAADRLSTDEHRRVLTACQQFGMRYIITDHSRITNQSSPCQELVAGLVQDFKGYPALGGYYVWDEPHREHFTAVAQVYAWLRQLDPDRLPVNAMFPSYGVYRYPDDYPAFAREFVQKVNPDVLSFDHYTITEKGPGDTFFTDLQTWSDLSLAHGKVLWFYPACCSWGGIVPPTLASLRFQAACALAYGARGLQWFTGRSQASDSIAFTHAPFNADGTPTRTARILRSVNLWVQSLSPALLQTRLVQTAHTPPVPAMCRAWTPGQMELERASSGLLLAEHRGPSNRWLLWVVNRSYQRFRNVSLTFTHPVRVRDLARGRVTSDHNCTLEFVLPAGDSALLDIRA